MPLVVPFLDDVHEIVVRSRHERPDGTVELHNEWASRRDIPAVLSALVRPDQLRWDDFATWAPDGVGTWRIRTRVFTEAVRCGGQTRIVEDGSGSRVELVGDLTLDVDGIRGMPRLLAGRLAPQLEKFVIALVTPNLERTNQAIGRFLDQEAR